MNTDIQAAKQINALGKIITLVEVKIKSDFDGCIHASELFDIKDKTTDQ